MARKERRDQPRIPVEMEVLLNPSEDGASGALQLGLRTRNVNARGAYLELPPPGDPPEPWVSRDWWQGRRVRIHASGPPLAGNCDSLCCEAEVRWVERRGPKRHAVGIGVLFHEATDEWLDALQVFLDSLVT
jgi:PilZ domain